MLHKDEINTWGKLVIISTICSNALLLLIIAGVYISPDTIKNHYPNIDNTWLWWQGINCYLLIDYWYTLRSLPKKGR